MNVPFSLQEILATIHRNQEQIDLLTANNTHLTNYLLQQGMMQNIAEMPALNGNGRETPLLPAAIDVSPGDGPREAPKRRRARRVRSSPAGLQTEALTKWARRHRGELNLAAFREASQAKGEFCDSFYKTTLYAKASQLAASGVLKKVSPGVYQLAR